MPVAKSNKILPGTDPTFHEFRRYMTPVIYRGKKIIAYVASCKQDACRWSGTYANNDTRELGMWRHRSEKVIEVRRDFFIRRYSNAVDKIDDLLLNVADKHSHTLETWSAAIETLWCRYTGLMPSEMPDYRGLVDYHLGVSAREAARKLIAQEYDV